MPNEEQELSETIADIQQLAAERGDDWVINQMVEWITETGLAGSFQTRVHVEGDSSFQIFVLVPRNPTPNATSRELAIDRNRAVVAKLRQLADLLEQSADMLGDATKRQA